MGETGAALSWFKELNEEEQAWATNYLVDRMPRDALAAIAFEVRRTPALLTQSICNLETMNEGWKLISRARNNLRQRRYRASAKGRATCSFTLPRDTKAKLKGLAKSSGTTETAIIESLIEAAQQLSQDRKEEKRREALQKTITRNASKLAQELSKIRLDATTRHLEISLKRLASWQVYLNEQPPELSSEQELEASKIAEKQMREIQEAIRAMLAKHELMSPRVI
ncbi:hypothetical protein [Stutzerimonas azotifigens]|uniref:hypothetical protein n=1 Tax=Stutzerimonas azotifigens TaxID=291995 RepID=UPI00048A27EE|nr:hypothetical protein [Stutzerimonas azotifigens]